MKGPWEIVSSKQWSLAKRFKRRLTRYPDGDGWGKRASHLEVRRHIAFLFPRIDS